MTRRPIPRYAAVATTAAVLAAVLAPAAQPSAQSHIIAAVFGAGTTINATHLKDKTVDTPNATLPIKAPSTYTFKLTDDSPNHNYRLLLNGKTVKDQTGKDVVTSVDGTPGEVKLRIKLRAKPNGSPQTYLLVCEPHRSAGMVVRIRVG